MGKETQSKMYQNKSRRWPKEWVFKVKEYGASDTFFKDLVAEDPASLKNALRMNSKKFNELIPCLTQLFSKKCQLCRRYHVSSGLYD